MSTEVHYFCSTAGQFEDTPFNGETPSNMVVIRFMLFRQVGSQSIDAPEDQIAWDEIKRDWHTEILAELLSNEIGVPDVKQPTIINQIFQAVELADIPGVPVTSIISDATIPYYGDDQTRVDRVTRERQQPKCIIPATKSSIERLEKVRLENLEATIRSTPCVICKEGLDRFDDGVEEDQLMITRLPCLHIFHGDCIVKWLETTALSWPMLLAVSAGGVIAAVLLCRLLKRS
ncbi:hypothetical protein M0R45_010433 [Rubus argutus]|uniref:RING-type E3 ubiquitin transferase n=1 Tax=Rubus argutus TaxID=59490 RepID=A0AAW1Y7C4_RUBAR